MMPTMLLPTSRPLDADVPMAVPVPLLLIDDDRELGELMRDYFLPQGYSMRVVGHGSTGLETALEERFALIILDVMLPGLDGFSVLRQLRKRSTTPVIMLTARVTEADRIAGLNAGADDYLIKPFGPGELLARVRAVLRRVGFSAPAPQEVIPFGTLTLLPAERQICRGEQVISLTDTEYDILEHLVRAAGRVVTRRELMTVLHQCEYAPYDRSLDVHVSHVRKKLGEDGAAIRTVRGEGYSLTASGKATS
jgi:two-component system, OmpR family, response regulator CpxR